MHVVAWMPSWPPLLEENLQGSTVYHLELGNKPQKLLERAQDTVIDVLHLLKSPPGENDYFSPSLSKELGKSYV